MRDPKFTGNVPTKSVEQLNNDAFEMLTDFAHMKILRIFYVKPKPKPMFFYPSIESAMASVAMAGIGYGGSETAD